MSGMMPCDHVGNVAHHHFRNGGPLPCDGESCYACDAGAPLYRSMDDIVWDWLDEIGAEERAKIYDRYTNPPVKSLGAEYPG